MELEFNLPSNAGLNQIEKFNELSKQLQNFILSGGNLSLSGKQQKETIKKAMLDRLDIESFIIDERDVRIMITLYREENLLETYPFTWKKCKYICGVTHLTLSPILSDYELSGFSISNEVNFSMRIIRQLIMFFLERYDQIECFEKLGILLRDHLSILPAAKRKVRDIQSFFEQCHIIFTSEGPKKVTDFSTRSHARLDVVAKKFFIPNTPRCRFYENAKNIYYIQTLKETPIGEDAPIFSELLRKEVKESPYNDGLMLGHEIAKIMIQRTLDTEEQKITDIWRENILSIMGDPRVPKSTANYQKWWGLMLQNHVDNMVKWLSGLDLKLFLQIIKEAAADDMHLLRMFESRIRFLEGLYENGYIDFSKLLINEKVERFIKKHYSSDKIPKYIKLRGESNKSLIYVRARNAHILEGTHDFSFRISKRKPTSSIDNSESLRFETIASIDKDTVRIYHTNNWQKKALDKLNSQPFNLDLSPQEVLSDEDYKIYRIEFGM